MRVIKFGTKLLGFSAKVGIGFAAGYLWKASENPATRR
jgi:hypothetical protein